MNYRETLAQMQADYAARVLRGSLLPILTAPGCDSVLVLPRRYWTAQFKTLWRSHRI